jgi:formamidopyrimidine-DNA glycosylase
MQTSLDCAGSLRELEVPELPEVEAVRRLFERRLIGKVVSDVEVVKDAIVFEKAPASAIVDALKGKKLVRAGRKGKYIWLETGSGEFLYLHLGMSGWVREITSESGKRLISHGKAPLDDAEGRPRFLKLLIQASDGTEIAFTDGRRLGRIWLGRNPEDEPRVKKLGPDAFWELPTARALHELYGKRAPSIKALLLDQSILSGIGNWVADEVLMHAGIAPARRGKDLSESDYKHLHTSIRKVLKLAVEAEADEKHYPANWLFHHRWGGKRGADKLGKHAIRRETIGGRTTAWIPDLQS